MLKPYQHVYSKFHEIQSFVNHLFLDVIFRSPYIANPEFDSSLVLPKYRDLIDSVNNTYVLDPLKKCFAICKNLSIRDLKILKRGVHVNNQIRLLCAAYLEPVEYSEIEKIDSELSKHIKTFCNYLYEESVQRAPFFNKYEKIESYYNKLVGRSRTCRACGINKVLTKFHSHRSAFDHYLPKGLYPFISINCNNLVPICDTCNSKYKTAKNTLFEIQEDSSKIRKKVFYPFSKILPYPSIDFNVLFNKAYNETITPNDISISISCEGYEEEAETWNKLFGIEENYKAEICTSEMHAFLEEQYMAEKNIGKSHAEYISLLESNRDYDCNFLKIAFLNGVDSYPI